MNATQHDLMWNAIFGALGGKSVLLAVASFASGEPFFGVLFALSAACMVGLCVWQTIDYDEEDV
jgi:hypothetical protein